MFDYPISIPQDTLYDELGIGPEATAHEVGDAHGETMRRLDQEIGAIQERLDAIDAQFPGLRDARLLVAGLDDQEAEDESANRKRSELAELERQAEIAEPEYHTLHDRVSELRKRITDLNQINLQSGDQRREYDEAHPPIDLLKLERDSRNPFANDKLDLSQILALVLLRRELASFLAEQGEAVFHPSDFTRTDFSREHTFHPLLDRE